MILRKPEIFESDLRSDILWPFSSEILKGSGSELS